MSAKERFLKKLQDKQPGRNVFENRAQADIAEFQQQMSQLQEKMETWLTGTGIQTQSTSVSLVELLIGGKTFSIPGIQLQYENRMVKFTPVFLYGQGVTGCVEASLCGEGIPTSLCRLFMRSTEQNHWTWRPAGWSTQPGGVFSEDVFFNMIEGLLS
ncbi:MULTISPECIES: hypothetical protein [Rahnella]|jgi:hypothetical protein|uniref:hypothetical protein n=1 Tax=Rahnella TaxID=34037 RepID=UPI00126602D0|nr:hypothetical protein [Rahnella sp. BIGb0603]KAB8310436.1 hypothetical protein EH227_07170 [Rouxiella chamberiensis]MCS3425349.1 hypothetical protein [Rahnella sp. BIGb0603]